jgi:hypothetical protein
MRKKPGVFEGRDNGRRPIRGLVISVMPLQPGYVRVTFDDVDRVARRPTITTLLRANRRLERAFGSEHPGRAGIC